MDSRLKSPQLLDGLADGAEVAAIGWDHASDRLVVAGHDDFLTPRHTIEKRAKAVLRLESGYGDHRSKLANRRLVFNRRPGVRGGTK